MKYRLTLLLLVFGLIVTGCSPQLGKAPATNEKGQLVLGNPNQEEDAAPLEDDVEFSGNSYQLETETSVMTDKPETPQEPINATQATITTSKGNVVIELYPDEAPNTVQNFLQKAQNGFYEGLTFHRVEDWVVQGGDPLGNGTGGGKMPTELNEVPFGVGSVGIARGQDIRVSNDAQFFICTKDCNFLTGQYTNFGKVIEGMDVVNSIAIGDTISGIDYQ